MKGLTPGVIAELTGGEYVGVASSRGVRVAGAVRDHRDVKPGNLFVCVRGAHVDGHDFAGSAFDLGAACCLAERAIPNAKGPYVLVGSTLDSIKTIGAYHRRLFDIPVIGITGSVGKTTTKDMVAAALGARFNVLKTTGNLNNELGVPLTLLSLDERHEAAVIEMGISDFGEMGRLAEMVRPDIFIITKIGYSHIKELGDLNGVLRAKTEAFAYMGPGGTAVLNGDDDLLRGYDPGMRKITFGLENHNDYRAESVRAEGADALTCDIFSSTGRHAIRVPAFGNHLAGAALAAAVIGDIAGLTGEELRRGLSSYAPVEGRANVIVTGYITIIDDCYNANPNSVKSALESLSVLPGRRVAILGDMLNLGEHSDKMHRETGACAASNSIDSLICSGENSLMICEGYLSAGGTAASHFKTNKELIAALPELIEQDDIVLVKASNSMRFNEIVQRLREPGLC